MCRLGRALLMATVLMLAVACPKSKVPIGGPHLANFGEIETKLAHAVVQPKASLGATLVRSGLLEAEGATFKGATAAASYRWKEVLILIRQGHPVAGFALHEFIKRGDVVYQTRPAGEEIALLPQVGASSASAYMVKGDWLLQVDIAPVKAKGAIPLDDLKTVVAALEL
jgi:hypothetical protein